MLGTTKISTKCTHLYFSISALKKLGVGLHKNKAITGRYSEIVLNLLFFKILEFTSLNHIKINLGGKMKISVNKDFHLKVIYEFHNFHLIGGNLQLVKRAIKLDLCLTFFSLQ